MNKKDLNTKNGKAAEYLFAARMMSLGHTILIPMDESNDYDFVVLRKNKPLKIQVRSVSYTKKNPVERYSVNFPRPDKDIDVLVCYIVPLNQWYLLPFRKLKYKNNSLCVNMSGNGESKYAKYRENWSIFDANFAQQK